LAVVLAAVVLSGCGSSSDQERETAPSGHGESAGAARIERCVKRLLEHAEVRSASTEEGLRRYIRDTYCARFERRGWIYDDGALSIAVQTWLTCRPTERAHGQVPCDPFLDRRTRRIECALLRYVRRSEVATYLNRLRNDGPVVCDDGSPLDELGVP